MRSHGLYLVCHEFLSEVKDFLGHFFDQIENDYNFSGWVTFAVPNSNFVINLMDGESLPLTQQIAFEVYCQSMSELEEYAQKFDCKVESFVSTSSKQKYNYYYVSVPGPNDILSVEVSYSEDIS